MPRSPSLKKLRRELRHDPAATASLQNMGHVHTSLGPAQYIKIRRYDDKPMSWREVWDRFADSFPGQWATMFFPPADELVDEANIYHLYVLDETPSGVNIKRR